MTTIPNYTPEERRKRIKAIIAAASGNLVEWFDFYIYAFFVKYFTEALMPDTIPVNEKELFGWLAFSASFFMRPLGSWLFGWMADKYGRKQSMLVSIVMMGAGSFCFALLPTYHYVGILAPILLLIVRLFQGLSVGGEYGAVATYMSEVALKGRKGFFASFQYVTLSGGQLLASLLSLICLFVFTEQSLKDGWWRLPFVIGGLAAIISLWVRRTLEETTTAEQRENKESGSLIALFKYHWKAFLTVVGYTAAGSLSFYTITVYSKDYITNIGISNKEAVGMITIGLLVFIILQPLIGLLSDYIGRRKCMLYFSSLMALCVFPAMAIGMGGNYERPMLIFVALLILLVILSFYTSISGLVKAEMFPTEVRALGVGFSYAIANAIFGGSAPTIAHYFANQYMDNIFFIYVIAMSVICFICSWRIPKNPDYLQER